MLDAETDRIMLGTGPQGELYTRSWKCRNASFEGREFNSTNEGGAVAAVERKGKVHAAGDFGWSAGGEAAAPWRRVLGFRQGTDPNQALL